MKKLIALAVAITLSISSLFAWTNIINLGVEGSVPTHANTILDGAEDFTFNATGAEFGYIGYFDFGLAVFDHTSVGLGTVKGEPFDSFADPIFGPMNFEVNELLGVGYGIIRNENLFLGAFGIIGSSTDIAFAGKEAENIANATAVVSESFLYGANVTCVYTPSKIFSVFASVSFCGTIGITTFASQSMEINEEKIEKSTLKKPAVKEHLNSPGIKVLPTIGVAWKF